MTVHRAVVCALPGCQAGVVEPGECCQGCVEACGGFLKRFDSDRSREQIAAELQARDAETRAAYAAQAAIRQSTAMMTAAGPRLRTETGS